MRKASLVFVVAIALASVVGPSAAVASSVRVTVVITPEAARYERGTLDERPRVTTMLAEQAPPAAPMSADDEGSSIPWIRLLSLPCLAIALPATVLALRILG